MSVPTNNIAGTDAPTAFAYAPLPVPPAPRMLTTDQARTYCGGMSTRAFYDFRARWQIPAVQLLPQTQRFDVADLDAALDRARREALVAAPKPKGGE